MKKVMLSITVAFLIITNSGDFDQVRDDVMKATGEDHADGFEFEGTDNSVNVPVATGPVNVLPGTDKLICFNTVTREWSVMTADEYNACLVSEVPDAVAAAASTETADETGG